MSDPMRQFVREAEGRCVSILCDLVRQTYSSAPIDRETFRRELVEARLLLVLPIDSHWAESYDWTCRVTSPTPPPLPDERP